MNARFRSLVSSIVILTTATTYGCATLQEQAEADQRRRNIEMVLSSPTIKKLMMESAQERAEKAQQDRQLLAQLIERLKESDRESSRLSEERGLQHALREITLLNAVLLRGDHAPAMGVQAYAAAFPTNDRASWSWIPEEASVSGLSAHTWGRYSIKDGGSGGVVLEQGTYLTHWQRTDGQVWKRALTILSRDTSNRLAAKP